MGDKEVAAAVNKVRFEVNALTGVVTRIGQASKEILDCLVSGATPPELLTELMEPTAAKQDFGKKKLILTLTAQAGAKKRLVEVVFEGVGEPKPGAPRESPLTSYTSDPPKAEEVLEFDLPQLWQSDEKPRFVTVNIIDPTPPLPPPPPPPMPPPPPPPPALTMRRILPATAPDHDEDDD
jgi:hypothetical protein